MSRRSILSEFELFSVGQEGIGGWLAEDSDDRIFQRLDTVEREPLTKVQLNQLLAFGHEAPVSDGFFRYYWLTASEDHPYDITKLTGYDHAWLDSSAVMSLAHLKFGLHRLFTDSLLYFGNVRTG